MTRPIIIECEVKNGVRYVRLEEVEKVVAKMQADHDTTLGLLRSLWHSGGFSVCDPAMNAPIKERLGL